MGAIVLGVGLGFIVAPLTGWSPFDWFAPGWGWVIWPAILFAAAIGAQAAMAGSQRCPRCGHALFEPQLRGIRILPSCPGCGLEIGGPGPR